MRTLGKITIIAFALIGFVASGFGIRALIQENKLDSAYECNCQDVKVGMTMDQAVLTMKKGLDINFRGYDYDIIMTDNKPVSFRLSYSTNGGSYIVTIDVDKENGIVTKTNCPPKD